MLYINGVTAVPWVNTINIPKRAKIITIVKSQYFFLTSKNSKNSFLNSNIKIAYPLS